MTKADLIMDVLVSVLDKCGYTLEDIHLMDRNTWDSIEKEMKSALRNRELDLSYTSDYSDKYDIKLSGNADSIINEFRYHYKINNTYGWRKVDINGSEIDNAKSFYETDRYGYVNKVSKDWFINLLTTNSNYDKHIGIGSQASIVSTRISIYMDNKDNLMYCKSVVIYD